MGAQLVRGNQMIPGSGIILPTMKDVLALLGGRFNIEHHRKGKRINVFDFKNGITDEGMNNLLDVHFHAGTQITTWYFGLIAGTGTLAAGDTLASHAGWTEFTDYTGNRLAWVEDAPASRSITNSTTTDFPITGSGTLKGAFLASVATGTAGILWSTGLFNADVPVANADTLKVTYTLSG